MEKFLAWREGKLSTFDLVEEHIHRFHNRDAKNAYKRVWGLSSSNSELINNTAFFVVGGLIKPEEVSEEIRPRVMTKVNVMQQIR
jgi:hypothetical protein